MQAVTGGCMVRALFVCGEGMKCFIPPVSLRGSGLHVKEPVFVFF